MTARPIFVGGMASHAGKSWMATAICAWLRRRGLRVAPFKAQNMSNNSCACPGGGEIGRAQAAQAEACGLVPEPDMNPILLKPTSDQGSQVVLNGRVWKTLPAPRILRALRLPPRPRPRRLRPPRPPLRIHHRRRRRQRRRAQPEESRPRATSASPAASTPPDSLSPTSTAAASSPPSSAPTTCSTTPSAPSSAPSP